MGHSKVVGAIEIGTSKIAILIGEISVNSTLNIIGQYSFSQGGKRVIADLRAAGQVVHPLFQAENTGTKIKEAYLAQTGQHLAGVFTGNRHRGRV